VYILRPSDQTSVSFYCALVPCATNRAAPDQMSIILNKLPSCAYPICHELLYRILYTLLLWLHVLALDEISAQLSLEISLDNPDIESPKIAEVKVSSFVI
jgi:hypothetical protein